MQKKHIQKPNLNQQVLVHLPSIQNILEDDYNRVGAYLNSND